MRKSGSVVNRSKETGVSVANKGFNLYIGKGVVCMELEFKASTCNILKNYCCKKG
jgi:hypothetical protein